MKKLFTLLICLFSLLAHAEIEVQVDPSQISKGESFQLRLTQESLQDNGVPNLTILQKEFIILGTAKNVSYSVINGQSHSSTQWVITLQPLKTGILTIPSIKVGTEQTNPITINVTQGKQIIYSRAESKSEDDVQLIARVENNKPYVNQQVIYKVALYNRKRLLDAEYQEPQVSDALLIPLGNAKRYQTTKNNKEYIVEEQSYAIYPQKSGNIKINSPVFSALVYDLNPQRIKAQDKAINLKVQTIPSTYKGADWLPARQVSLLEKYESTKQTLAQGSTLVRTITIEGVGVPAQLMPSLQFDESKDFNVYVEKGKEHNQVTQGQITGSLSLKVTYLFKESGNVTIPEVKLPWFNTSTGKEEHAILPPRSIEITPSAAAVPSTPQGSAIKTTMSGSTQTTAPTTNNSWPWLIALLFALAWVITLLLWFWQKYSRASGKGKYKKALEELNQSCAECNPIKARDALLNWASLHWPDAPMLNLSDVSKLVRDVHLKKQLHQLAQVLYKNNEKVLWRGDELARSIQAISKAKNKSRHKTKRALPPINPG